MEWKEVTAKDFCIEVTDGTHDSPKPQEEGHYLITSKHLREFEIDFSKAYKISDEDYCKVIERSNVEQYDILFSMIGTIGTLHRVTTPLVDYAVKNMGIFKMGGDNTKSLWLYYWLKSPKAQEYMHSTLAGSTQSYLTLKTLRSFPIQVPCEKDMYRIAAILSSLDRKIELNNKINAQLEEMAQTLFKHWFVDFGPFKDGKFVESELGMIPEGWSVNSISELIKTTSGGTPSRKNIEYYEHGCIDWIKSKELNGGFIFDSEEKITDEAIKDSSAKILPQYSVLIAMYGATVGEYGIISKPMACNQAICALMPNSSLPYSYLFLFAKNYKDVLTNMAIGSAQQNISQLTIKNLKIAYNKKAFISFHNLIAGILRKISKMTEENLRLASLRDTLLPKLMSGEINLEDYGGE